MSNLQIYILGWVIAVAVLGVISVVINVHVICKTLGEIQELLQAIWDELNGNDDDEA